MTNLTQNCPRSLDTSLSIELRIGLVVLVLLFSFAMQLNHANMASAAPNISYNCSANPQTTSGHCYSETGWLGAKGAFTNIFTNQLHAGNGFVTNEMWLENLSITRWIEGGLQTVATSVCMQQGSVGQYCPNTTAEFLFWGDTNNGGSFYFHPGPTLASSDFGKFAAVEILRTSPTSNEYAVYLTLPSGSQVSGFSTNNTMSDDEIHLGAEMQGTSGATAPTNGYTNSEWYNYNNGLWQTQGDPPTNTDLGTHAQLVMSPWKGSWAALPSTDGVGGDWRTCLIGAGC